MQSSNKWFSIGVSAAVAGAGAFLATVGSYASSTDLGAYGPIVGAICAVLVDAVRHYATPAPIGGATPVPPVPPAPPAK